MEVLFKKLSDSATTPERGSASAAGYDLFADLSGDVSIASGETVLIGTGLSMAIPDGYFGGIFARSGLSTKEGLRPANCVGVIDSDYRGEIKVALHNDSNTVRTVTHGEKIAQLVVIPYLTLELKETAVLPDTERGDGGFGSTGK